MSWHVVNVVVSMTTFFEVFYTNNVFLRYVRTYGAVTTLLSAELSLFMRLRFHYSRKNVHWARLIMRYAVASVFVFLRDPEGKSAVTEDEWNNLLRLGLIHEEERKNLELYSRRHCSLVLLHWSARVVVESTEKMKLTSNVMRYLLAELRKVRKMKQEIVDTVRLPVPFQYFHLLNVMLCVNLGIWAYGFGVMQSAFAPVGFFFAELIFCGLMEMAAQLSDPFGKDEVDLPLEEYLLSHWQNSIFLIEECPPPDETREDLLAMVNVCDKPSLRGRMSVDRSFGRPDSPTRPSMRSMNSYLSGEEDSDDDYD
jgi:predicted membrane chloride channel (bestrophin family)